MRQATPEIFPSDFSPEAYQAEHKTKTLPVADGDVFDLGGVRLTVVHIPGHTPGGIALLNDRDRLLLVGDSASLHVWMFLQESTSIATYVQSLQRLREMGNQYDAIVASHVRSLLPKELISRLIHCARNIDPLRSVHYESPVDDTGPGTMYFEGLESLAQALGMKALDLTVQPLYTLNLEALDLSRVTFVSIVYNETKL